MKRVYKAYKELLGILWKEAPVLVFATFVTAIFYGLATPLQVFVNRHIFDDGLLVAQKVMSFNEYLPYLILLVITLVLPSILNEIIVYGLVEPRVMLILNTSYKGKMLQKLKKMKYEHMENPESMEIIDKAFHRAINAARHLFPMYVFHNLTSLITSIGALIIIGRVRWWLIFTLLIPFAIETYTSSKQNTNIYLEMEKYWNKERRYYTLAGFLKSKDYLYEGKLNGSSDYLVDTYEHRLNSRNKEYEAYYLKHLKRQFMNGNITKVAALVNSLILLYLYINGSITVGTLLSLTIYILTMVYQYLGGCFQIIRWGGFHVNSLDYYNKFFELSEEVEEKKENASPVTATDSEYDIEFKNVWFGYPGKDNPYILKGLSFKIKAGEKISIVGENGEGKSTMIKLLLGLFEPNEGEILLRGKHISQYTREERNQLLAPIFQDFGRYSITLKENIALGNIRDLSNDTAIIEAAKKGQAEGIASKLTNGFDTLLGKDFEGGTDLSGGQWQRIAIARAFMGEKPIILLDEPTSQLDPMAESRLYSDFHSMCNGKTAIFITHRLASTMITDRILVISKGVVSEEGSHDELMKIGGIYYEMFEAQKKWYQHEEGGECSLPVDCQV